MAHFNASLAQIELKLITARSEIEKITSSISTNTPLDSISLALGYRKKARYSVYETHLRKTAAELSKWQAVFDPSWLFLIRLSSSSIDTALADHRQHDRDKSTVIDHVKAIREVLRDLESDDQRKIPQVFRPHGFLSTTRTALQESSTELSALGSDFERSVLVDTTTYPREVGATDMRRQVRDMARILMRSDPKILGLLKCLGVLELQVAPMAVKQFQLIYAIPDGMSQPSTLRSRLRNPSPSQDDKILLACAIGRGVASVHAAGFVHKNIRPETILTFENKHNSSLTAYLVGFERFRSEQASTTLTGDMVWYNNLYRHPRRQGRNPDERYEMQHNIYSLGVCLLEVGLWRSLVIQKEPPKTDPELVIDTDLKLKNKIQAALNIKAKLMDLAQEKLAAWMGRTYTEVVMSCFTCLDQKQSNMFASDEDLRDQDDIIVGVVFVQQVLSRLLSIRVSD